MIRFEFRNLDISSILPNPFRPRFDINRQELINLADSIRQYGIIEPIIVVKSSAGYQILSGERRWKAAKLAGLTEIPAMIGEIGKTDAEIIFLEILRKHQPINLLEQAQIVERILSSQSVTLEALSHRLHMTSEELESLRNVAKLPARIKEQYAKKQLSDDQLLQFTKEEDKLVIFYKSKA